MSFSEIMGLVAGALQFTVAGYALRLNRLFGPARVGWSLFWAFLLLALLHVVQSVTQFHASNLSIEMSVVYALISLLMLTAMVHLETVLKERLRVEQEERRMKAELEVEVQKKTGYLMRAIEELQAEMDERKRMEAEVDTAHWELRAVSGKAEIARIATDVLESVGGMIQNVDASMGAISEQVKQSKIANIVRVGTLIREQSKDLTGFMMFDPRGQKLPIYIAQLAEHLEAEQAKLLVELDAMKANLQKVMALQQDYAKLASGTQTAAVAQWDPSPNEPLEADHTAFHA